MCMFPRSLFRPSSTANIPVSKLSAVAVATAVVPPLDKSMVNDAVLAISRTTADLVSLGKSVTLDVAPLGSFAAHRIKGQVESTGSFNMNRNFAAAVAPPAPARSQRRVDHRRAVPTAAGSRGAHGRHGGPAAHRRGIAALKASMGLGMGRRPKKSVGAPADARRTAAGRNGSRPRTRDHWGSASRVGGEGSVYAGSRPRSAARGSQSRQMDRLRQGLGGPAPGAARKAWGGDAARSSHSRRRPAAAGAGVGAGAGAAGPAGRRRQSRTGAGRPRGGEDDAFRNVRAAKPAKPAPGPGWKDPEFPPGPGSLCYNWQTCSDEDYWRTLVWRRAHEFADDGVPVLFEGGVSENDVVQNTHVSPHDIHQGALNDCYFLCAVSALAEFDFHITRLFTETDTVNGRYTVKWHHDGEPVEVTVDDWFPCDPKTGEPAFSRCIGSEVWVLVLEKAWAKKHGSYQQIESGNCSEVLSAFTGAPERTFELKVRTGVLGRAVEGGGGG